MAKFAVTLTDGHADWLVTVEAGSKREAKSKALTMHLVHRHQSVEVKACVKEDERLRVKPKMPSHVAALLGRDK